MRKGMGIVVFAFFIAVSGCVLDEPSAAPSLPGDTNQGLAMGMGFDPDKLAQSEPGTEFERFTGSTVSGLDVSYYQGTVNWTSVYSAGYRFAFARVSDGTKTIDSQFANNWAGMKSAGLIRGAYQFFRPLQDATAQANLMLSKIGTLSSGDLPPVLDVEVTDGASGAAIVAGIKTWVSIVKSATGKTPIIYTAKYFWNALPDTSTIGTVTLWVANWGVSNPALPSLWTSWTFWQYSATGSVSGISGDVDLDYYNGTLSSLQSYASVTTTTTTTTVASASYGKPFTRTLQYTSPNMTGSDVKLLQLLYNDWAKASGLSSITVDGIFGSGTKSAVTTFQSKNGLSATGVADASTLNKMISVFAARSTYYSPYYRTLYVTSPMINGSDVKTLQTSYNTWAASNGKSSITVDGYYGNGTKTAVTTFQNTETALLGTPDGIAGIHTQRLLFIRSYR